MPGSLGLRIDSGSDGAGGDEGLRIAFDVTKTMDGGSNKATIVVTNLSADSRSRVVKGAVARLRAGYGDELELIYEGEVRRAPQSERQGPDFVTTMECGDGVEAFRAQDVKKTFPAGTSVKAVILAVAKRFTEALPDDERMPVHFGKTVKKKTKASRLSVRTLDADLVVLERSLKEQGFSTVLRRALSVSGSANEVMDSLARLYRFDWSVQDGAIQIVAYGATLIGEAVVLGPETGLLGVPAPTDFGCKFTALLIPRLRPGAAVVIRSDTLSGQFRLETAHLSGDTRADSWTIECEARSL